MGPDPQRPLARCQRIAAGYDASSRREWPRHLRAIERLALAPGATVLDVAGGTGLSFAPLLEQVGGTVVGVELSPQMAAVARADRGGRLAGCSPARH